MKDLTISSGQPGRLVFNLSGGAASLTPVGWIAVTEYPGAKPVATQMQWVAADHALYLPPLPFGCFFYEVRVGALEVAKGHIDVTPSPFPYDGQEYKTWVVTDGDMVNDVATFNIDADPGLQGPQGEKGEKGDTGDTGPQGPQGEKGEALAYADLTEAQRAELVEPLVYEEATVAPGGNVEDNYNAYGFGIEMRLTGRVTALELECRDNESATPANAPMWLKVWRGETQQMITVSANAQTHAVGEVLHYTFAETFSVVAGEEIRVSFHAEDGLATTAYQMGQQCCLRVLAKEPTTPGGILGLAGGYGADGNVTQRSWIPKHTWHMQISRFAPAAHTADTTAHMTAEEHAGLVDLLANKDALLALLNS